MVPEDAPLTQLEVRGEFEHLAVEDVHVAAAPYLGTSFFAADVTAMRDAVAALPWVASVRAADCYVPLGAATAAVLVGEEQIADKVLEIVK